MIHRDTRRARLPLVIERRYRRSGQSRKAGAVVRLGTPRALPCPARSSPREDRGETTAADHGLLTVIDAALPVQVSVECVTEPTVNRTLATRLGCVRESEHWPFAPVVQLPLPVAPLLHVQLTVALLTALPAASTTRTVTVAVQSRPLLTDVLVRSVDMLVAAGTVADAWAEFVDSFPLLSTARTT